MTAVEQLTTCVTCHAWNADKSKIAFCPNNNEVLIYKKAGSGWEEESRLTEHDHVVTGIDWGATTNRIVTCSQDRNAYVWQFQEGQWKPTLVILRINRCATKVKWSPDEQKFAVASGAKTVSVCYFEEDNDWWVSKHIKKFKSTVLSVAWSPNNVFLATGSSDFKARVFSAYIKGLDKEPAAGPFGSSYAFGNCLAEYGAAGWVHDVAWSPSGNRLAYVSHDSTISFLDVSSQNVERLPLPCLPFRAVLFLTDNSVVAAGHDCNPMLFNNTGSWAFARNVDEAKSSGAAAGNQSAMSMWQKKVDLGTTQNETTLDTKHQNAISCLQPVQVAGGKVGKFSTTGVDGKLAIWDTASLGLK